MRALGSVLFTIVMFASVAPYSLIVVAARVFGARAAYGAVIGWIRGTVWLCRVLCGIRWSVEGRENLPPGNHIVVLKHSSTYETLVQLLLFPRQCWVLKRELMWAPFLGWALATLKPIAVQRGAGRAAVDQVVRQGAERLEAGLWVTIFPEGTRMPPDKTRRYGISAPLLASATGRPLVPVAHNAGDFWPRRGWLKRSGTVRFCIGPPVDPANRDPREVNAELQAWIEAKVAELRG